MGPVSVALKTMLSQTGCVWDQVDTQGMIGKVAKICSESLIQNDQGRNFSGEKC